MFLIFMLSLLSSLCLHLFLFLSLVCHLLCLTSHSSAHTFLQTNCYCAEGGLRVHLQVMLWKRLTHEDLEFDPERWGWKLDGTRLSSIMTDLAAAPKALLKFVRCKCKLTSTNPCGTNTCSCRKHGLKCITACGDCRGVNCLNAEDDFIADLEENLTWKTKMQCYRT